MIKQVRITEIGLPEAAFAHRDAFGREIVAPVLKQLIRRWHRDFLPDHFREGAQARYHYKARTEKYKKRKRILAAARGRTALPLVYTGRMKREVERNIKIKETQKGAEGIMTGPRYLYLYGQGGVRPHLAGELTTQTQGELDQQALLAGRLTLELLNNEKTKVTHRIG